MTGQTDPIPRTPSAASARSILPAHWGLASVLAGLGCGAPPQAIASCLANAVFEAAERPSRLSAFLMARDRVGDTRRLAFCARFNVLYRAWLISSSLKELAALYSPAPVRRFPLRHPRSAPPRMPVEYRDLQFIKAPEVVRGMRLSHLDKSENAKQELAAKGFG